MCSITASAASRSCTRARSRPHEPDDGFSTAGYPFSSTARSADSASSAIRVRGVGTPRVASRTDVASLSPHASITAARLMHGTPYPSNTRTAASACVWLMHRSSTAEKRRHGAPS